MGNDPVNLVDPTGGVSNPIANALRQVACPGSGCIGNIGKILSTAGTVGGYLGTGMRTAGLINSIGQRQRNINSSLLNLGIGGEGEENNNGIYLVFDGSSNQLSIYAESGEDNRVEDDNLIGVYEAHNNVSSKSRGKWEDGVYEMEDQLKRRTRKDKEPSGILQDSDNGRYGEGGIYRAKSFRETSGKKQYRSGMAVHSGRANKPFEKRVTMGCVRTTKEGMTAIDNAISKYGRLKRIYIINNHASSNSSRVNNLKFGDWMRYRSGKPAWLEFFEKFFRK
jgi:hypothetical protein